MVFNSYGFLIFFALVAVLYFAVEQKYRWPVLLAASYYFYMCWKAEYALILVAVTLIDYAIALAIARSQNPVNCKWLLRLSLSLSIGSLFVFKYLDFFSQSMREMLSLFNIMYDSPSFQLLQPVGLSYYTFKKISYMVDVYRGNLTPERHLGKFALYLAFFPELTAGPIDRAGDLLPQFNFRHRPEYQRIIDGFKLFVWGMFKKVVVADRFATLVDRVYNQPGDY